MTTYEEFLEKINEGIEYANTIRGNISVEELKSIMMNWVVCNIPTQDCIKIFEKDPSKQEDMIERMLALGYEGRILEDSILRQ